MRAPEAPILLLADYRAVAARLSDSMLRPRLSAVALLRVPASLLTAARVMPGSSFPGRLRRLPPAPVAAPSLLGPGSRQGARCSLAVGDPSASRRTAARFCDRGAGHASAAFRQLSRHRRHRGLAPGRRGWLNRRFAPNGAIDPEKHLLPLNGTREGLFSALFPFMPESKAAAAPSWRCPIPFYSMLCGGGPGSGRRAALCAGAAREWLPAGLCRACRRRRCSGWPRRLFCCPPIPKARWRTRPIGRRCSRWPTATTSSCWRTNVTADIWFDEAAALRPYRARLAQAAASPAADLPFSVQAFGPAGPALRHGGGRAS